MRKKINKNTQIILQSSKKDVLEVNADKTEHILMPRQQNAGQHHNMKKTTGSFENVVQFKRLEMISTNQNGEQDLGCFFSFLIYTKSVGILGRAISPSQGLHLHTEQHKHRINAHRHQCLVWDSNPRSQCSSEPRQFIFRPRGHCDWHYYYY
jgi:hypothetical protein